LKRVLLVAGVTVLLLNGPALTSELAVIVLNTANWQSHSLPSDWQIKVTHGKPDVSVCSDADGSCLHLKSVRASFAVERGVNVDPKLTRFLTWRWKVAQLPAAGDFRRAGTDDQAAQVLVAFADRRVLSYIWDTTAPKGTAQSASVIPLVHVFAIVCQSGASDLNRWIPEAHDVAADYERAYGRSAPLIKGLRLQINSQHTGTTAESYFGEVAFRSTLP
jgi:DUF3047 family protein